MNSYMLSILIGCIASGAISVNEPNFDVIQKDPEVVFLGDSITYGWAIEGIEIWRREFEPRGAVCLAVGRERTWHVSALLDHEYFEAVDPSSIVLLIGTNELSTLDASKITENIETLVKKIRKLWPEAQMVLLEILPRFDVFINPDAKNKIPIINQRLRKIDGITVISVPMKEDMYRDGLHLNASGYDVLAESIIAVLEKRQ